MELEFKCLTSENKLSLLDWGTNVICSQVSKPKMIACTSPTDRMSQYIISLSSNGRHLWMWVSGLEAWTRKQRRTSISLPCLSSEFTGNQRMRTNLSMSGRLMKKTKKTQMKRSKEMKTVRKMSFLLWETMGRFSLITKMTLFPNTSRCIK